MPPNLPLMPPKHFRCLILLDWHKVIGRPQSDPVLQSFRNGAGSLQLGLWKPQAAAPADRWSETGATGQSYRERPFLRDPIANPMFCVVTVTANKLANLPMPMTRNPDLLKIDPSLLDLVGLSDRRSGKKRRTVPRTTRSSGSRLSAGHRPASVEGFFAIP